MASSTALRSGRAASPGKSVARSSLSRDRTRPATRSITSGQERRPAAALSWAQPSLPSASTTALRAAAHGSVRTRRRSDGPESSPGTHPCRRSSASTSATQLGHCAPEEAAPEVGTAAEEGAEERAAAEEGAEERAAAEEGAEERAADEETPEEEVVGGRAPESRAMAAAPARGEPSQKMRSGGVAPAER